MRSGALLRLIAYAGIARRLEKCYRKNRRAGFSFTVQKHFDYSDTFHLSICAIHIFIPKYIIF
ncbi:MAG TPA: hypothetical protein O0W87_04545, partial [Methanocorpusculum sp.]|nr:hypothetical protein [Methanocorpusculum sp.]